MHLHALSRTVLCLLITCYHSSESYSQVRLAAPSGAAVEPLSATQKAQFFASLAKAAYCGADNPCSVSEDFQNNLQYFGISALLKDWQIAFLSARDLSKDIEGYLFFHPDAPEVYISIRGSDQFSQPGGFQDWLATNGRLLPNFFAGKHIRGYVHAGYLDAMYGLWHPNETGLLRVLSDHNLWNRQFYLTGHSLGGAVAALLAMRLNDEGQSVAGIYSFGAPRMAFWNFQGSYNARLEEVTHHFVHPEDPVPRVLVNFVNVGKTWLFNGSTLVATDKDGAGAWDPLTAFFSGDIFAHTMSAHVPQGYFQSLKRLRTDPPESPKPPASPQPKPTRAEPAEGIYLLVNQHSGKCLNLNVSAINQTGYDNFEKIQQYDCPRTEEEAWTNNFWSLKKEGGAAYSIVSSYSEKCVDLDTSNGGKGNGNKIHQYDCLMRREIKNRNWYFINSGTPDVYHIESAWSGKCMELSVTNPQRDGFANKEGLQQWDCRPRAYEQNQLWRLIRKP